jgi:hypothetical protein
VKTRFLGILGLGLLLSACGAPDDELVAEAPGRVIEGDGFRMIVYREAQLTDAASVPQDLPGYRSVEVFQDRLVFTFDGSPGSSLDVGRVVAGASDALEGYVRTVTALSELGDGRFEVETEPAMLTDFYADYAFHYETTPYADQWISSDDGDENFAGGDQVSPLSYRTQGEDEPELTGGRGKLVSLFRRSGAAFTCDDASGFNASLSTGLANLDNEWSVVPSFWFDYDVSVPDDSVWPAVAMVTAGGQVEISAKASVKMSQSAGLECGWEYENALPIWKFAHVVPGTVVVLEHTIKPKASAKVTAKLEVKGDFDLHYTQTLLFGAGYYGRDYMKDYDGPRGELGSWTPELNTPPPVPTAVKTDGWVPFKRNDYKLVPEPHMGGQLSVDATARAGLTYGIAVMGLAGPTFSIEPTLSAEFLTSSECAMGYRGKAGLELTAGGLVKVPVIDLTIASLTLGELEFVGYDTGEKSLNSTACSGDDPWVLECNQGWNECFKEPHPADGACSCMSRFVPSAVETAGCETMDIVAACETDLYPCCAVNVVSPVGECQCWDAEQLAPYYEQFGDYQESCKHFTADITNDITNELGDNWIPSEKCPADMTPEPAAAQRFGSVEEAIEHLPERLRRRLMR